jgi:phytanoyl-CoA hydroxylase
MNCSVTISNTEAQFFKENGYLIKRQVVGLETINALQKVVSDHLQQRVKPFELEQEVNYPGSPTSINEIGGDTIRRLKMAYARDEVFAQWIKHPKIIAVLKKLFQSDQIFFVQSHHNCIMTKQPQYSSETHWHKDTRYWHFENNQLINTWLPLGNETKINGCLHVIPKSHLWSTSRDLLDERLFLRKDLAKNQKWLETAIDVELQQGDLLIFHAAIFHAAGRNTTQQSKNAVVSTYHSELNSPKENTNSTAFAEISLSND